MLTLQFILSLIELIGRSDIPNLQFRLNCENYHCLTAHCNAFQEPAILESEELRISPLELVTTTVFQFTPVELYTHPTTNTILLPFSNAKRIA